MEKTKIFENMHVAPEGLLELNEYLTRPGGIFDEPHLTEFELIAPGHAHWRFSAFNDFLAEYEPLIFALYERRRPGFRVSIVNFDDLNNVRSRVTVMAQDSQAIDDIFKIIEKYCAVSLFFLLNSSEESSSRHKTQSPVQKTQTIKHMHLVRQGLKELDQYLTCQGGIFGDPHTSLFEIVYPDGKRREFDKSPAFLAEYYPTFFARYERSRPGFEISIVNTADFSDLFSTVAVLAQDRRTIHEIFDIIEKYHTQSVFFPADPKESAENLYASLKREREKAAPAHKLNAGATACHSEGAADIRGERT